MTCVIILSIKKHGEKWKPFKADSRDIKRIIEDLWTKKIKYSDKFKSKLIQKFGYVPDCMCVYPPKIRPAENKLREYDGCVFDLDAYNEGKEDYLVTEVKSLKSPLEIVLAGGISVKMTDITPEECWFNKPIKDVDDVAEYLYSLMVHIPYKLWKKNDPESSDGLDKHIYKTHKDLSGRWVYQRGPIDMQVKTNPNISKTIIETLDLVKEEKKMEFIEYLFDEFDDSVNYARNYAKANRVDYKERLSREISTKKLAIGDFCKNGC